MNDSLKNDLPTDRSACVTDLEAALFGCESFHTKLRRPAEVIKEHARTCAECRSRLERATANLERDKAKLTQLISQANQPREKDLTTEEMSAAKSAPSNHAQFGEPLQNAKSQGSTEKIPFFRIDKNGADSRRLEDYAVSRWSGQDPAKEFVAHYVAKKLCIPDGAGLFVDAGSQCFLAYKAFAEYANRKDLYGMHLVTSNMFVLDSWMQNHSKARARFPTIEIAGGQVDVEHRAFYGINESRVFESFRASLALIGACGFEVEPGRLWLGTHAGDHEIKDKERLFRSPAKKRAILLTPGKIGEAGSRPLDLLSIEGCTEGPIYIITASPVAVNDRDNYEKAREALRSEETLGKLRQKRIELHWVTVNGIDDQEVQFQDEVFPGETKRDVGSLSADFRLHTSQAI
jgi:hypothetical protein